MSAVIVVVFWTSFIALAAGLPLWLAVPAGDAGALALASGLLGLLLIPMLRLLWALAAASARRDWLMLGATLTVLAILIALTLRVRRWCGESLRRPRLPRPPRRLAACGGTKTRRHDDNDESLVSHFDGLLPLAARRDCAVTG